MFVLTLFIFLFVSVESLDALITDAQSIPETTAYVNGVDLLTNTQATAHSPISNGSHTEVEIQAWNGLQNVTLTNDLLVNTLYDSAYEGGTANSIKAGTQVSAHSIRYDTPNTYQTTADALFTFNGPVIAVSYTPLPLQLSDFLDIVTYDGPRDDLESLQTGIDSALAPSLHDYIQGPNLSNYTLTGPAASNQLRVGFENTESNDNIRVFTLAPVSTPEPSTYLMLASFAAIAALIVRKRNRRFSTDGKGLEIPFSAGQAVSHRK